MTKKNIRKHYHRSGNQISDHNFSAWKTVRRIPMKIRFYISGGKKLKRRIISIFMSVIVLINIIVPVYASTAAKLSVL